MFAVLLHSKSNTAFTAAKISLEWQLLFFSFVAHSDSSLFAQYKINWLTERCHIGFKEMKESTAVDKGRCSSIWALDELKTNFDSQGFSGTDLYPLSSS